MSDPQALQFDHVEFQSGSTNATPCAQCRQPIIQSYYEVNGRLICSRCHEELTQGTDGSRALRIGRALCAGLLAAVLGAILWWGVRKLTGYEVGLISIAIGIGVGKAVRWGSRNRGGWAYQLMAILLTYAAVAGNYMPDTVQALRDQAQKEETVSPTAAGKANESKASAAPPADHSVPIGGLLLALVVVFCIAAAAPFLAGADNIIGILIIGFGLYQAWKINKRVPPTVTGPFSVAPAPPSPVPNV